MQQLLGAATSLAPLGAWLRGAKYPADIRGACGYAGCRLLVSPDLGFLLGRCAYVALREGTDAVVLAAEEVIQWRALQVLTATPYLPDADHLEQVFPGASLDPTGFHISLKDRGPEAVLADCLTREIPVLGSRIIYCAPLTAANPVHPRFG